MLARCLAALAATSGRNSGVSSLYMIQVIAILLVGDEFQQPRIGHEYRDILGIHFSNRRRQPRGDIADSSTEISGIHANRSNHLLAEGTSIAVR